MPVSSRRSEEEGVMFLRNVGNHLQDHMVSQLRRPHCTLATYLGSNQFEFCQTVWTVFFYKSQTVQVNAVIIH
jgi:hypothetical protein